MTKKTLEELAVEYSAALDILDKQIEACRTEIISARLRHRNIILNDLNRKLSVLYDQRNELRETQAHLRHYYDDELRYAG